MLVKDGVTWDMIIQRGKGFIYNDFGTQFRWNLPDFNKLHKASCRCVRTMTYVRKENLSNIFSRLEKKPLIGLRTTERKLVMFHVRLAVPNRS